MAIFPVRIPYSLQKPKNLYRRDFSPQVATLLRWRYKQLLAESTPTLEAQPYAGGTSLRWWYRRR